MSSVVFLRAVNVGGHKAFQPTAVAKALAHCGALNIGAAGTFIIRERIAQAELRAELARCLPWDCEMMIAAAREVTRLAGGGLFPQGPSYMDLHRFVSVLARRPRRIPRLPFLFPAGADWQVKVIRVTGRFALTLWRRLGKTFVDPNGVVEKLLGVRSTTRNWNTILRISERLQAG